MGPGPFWIENRKLEKKPKIKSSMIIGFQKNQDSGLVGGVSSIHFFGCLDFLLTLQGPLGVIDY